MKNRRRSKFPFDVVPDTTIRKYVDMVVGVPDFNMMNCASNKTESRHSAE